MSSRSCEILLYNHSPLLFVLTTKHCQGPVIKRITVTFNYYKTSFLYLQSTAESNTLYTVEF